MKRMILPLFLAAAVAGCASYPRQSDAERLALYHQHAGEPVRDFQIFGRGLTGWTPLGDSAMAVWTKPGQAYLLELGGPCMDLNYAPAISISNMLDRVSARFDKVYVIGGANPMRMSCRIETIRPLDVKTLRQAEKELRKASIQAREASAEGEAQPSGT